MVMPVRMVGMVPLMLVVQMLRRKRRVPCGREGFNFAPEIRAADRQHRRFRHELIRANTEGVIEQTRLHKALAARRCKAVSSARLLERTAEFALRIRFERQMTLHR